MAYHINFVDGWDEQLQEPTGGGRCGPSVDHAHEVPDAVRWLRRQARLNDWGPGEVVVLDDNYQRVHLDRNKDLAEGCK